MPVIPLMRNALINETETREALADFIRKAPRLSMDAKCFEFERTFAANQGRNDAILFNSGGSANLALIQALKNLGRLKDGDRVGFSALTWSTNIMPIIQLGLVPVPVDCDPSTLNVMSTNLLDRIRQTPMTALFLTNVLGFAGDLAAIRAICEERSILLIEDNCEALGTELPAGKTGSFGAAATFSFFIAHHMSTIEGGMVCTDDEELAMMLRIVRANGWDRNLTLSQQSMLRDRHAVGGEFQAKYTFYDLGYNLRPTEITGFIGLQQLPFLEDSISKRESNYLFLEGRSKYNKDLVPLLREHLSRLSSFAFPIICRTRELRDRYLERFEALGVEVRPLIAGNMQRQPFYSRYVTTSYELPGADLVHERGFYCGNHPEMSPDELETLASAVSPH